MTNRDDIDDSIPALQRRLSCLAAEPTITVAARNGRWFAILADVSTMTIGHGNGGDIVEAISAAELDFRQTVAARWMQERGEMAGVQ